MKPLCVDLYCGLGGWSAAFLAEGWRVIGYDIEAHEYGDQKYPGELILRDVLTIHGSELKDANCIVASPPCQEYSYMAMPWNRAKAISAEYRSGKRDVKKLTALFDACFRIQREAIVAAGRHIPMVVENVRGAQPWVGRARFNFGSYYVWGDVPALMPIPQKAQKFNPDCGHKTEGHINKRNGHSHTRHLTNQAESYGVKQPGISGKRENGKGDKWFQDGAAAHGSRSPSRKAASAMIAKIPFPLAQWIARCFHPSKSLTTL